MLEDGIVLEGYEGTWYTIGTEFIDRKPYFLLESEQHGDEVPCIIIDRDFDVVLDDVQNGFDDLREYLG